MKHLLSEWRGTWEITNTSSVRLSSGLADDNQKDALAKRPIRDKF